MYALDFEYDGRYLSDYGFMICTLGTSSDFDAVSAGSSITFNKVPRHRGKIHTLTGTQYDECLSATFDICKNTNIFENLHISNVEFREIMRWLNRKEFLPFRLLGWEYEETDTCFYNASFNVEKVLVNHELFALTITMETDKPFGYAADRKQMWTITDVSKPVVLSDTSDEIGYIYPSMKITCNAEGNLTIKNEIGDCEMVINNCSNGEVITIDGSTHIIQSSVSSHHIYNDFNFEYFRIGNTMKSNLNKITVSLPCKLELVYSPIIKDSPQ